MSLDIVDTRAGTAVEDTDAPLAGRLLVEANDAFVADGRRFLIHEHGYPLASARLVLDDKLLDTLPQRNILL